MRKITAFVLPILDLGLPYLNKNGFKDSYLGDSEYTGTNEWGENLFLRFHTDLIQDTLENTLMSSEEFITSYASGENAEYTIFVFDLDDQIRETIIKPFLDGKYSEIDRVYVKNNFPKYVKGSNGRLKNSRNYKILHKDPKLAEQWEERLGVTFTEEMEV
jgi:hypothetical protein